MSEGGDAHLFAKLWLRCIFACSVMLNGNSRLQVGHVGTVLRHTVTRFRG